EYKRQSPGIDEYENLQAYLKDIELDNQENFQTFKSFVIPFLVKLSTISSDHADDDSLTYKTFESYENNVNNSLWFSGAGAAAGGIAFALKGLNVIKEESNSKKFIETVGKQLRKPGT